MASFRESDLPGIGRKFQLDTRSGYRVVVIVHEDGRREIYHFAPGEDEDYASEVTLDDEEARQLGAVISGVIYKPAVLEEAEVSLERLVIDWLRVGPDAPAAGRTIGELRVRQVTGATLIAVIDPDRATHITPGPERAIPAGATVVVAGNREQVQAFKRALLRGSP